MTPMYQCEALFCERYATWQITYRVRGTNDYENAFACTEHLSQVIKSCPSKAFACIRIESEPPQGEDDKCVGTASIQEPQ